MGYFKKRNEHWYTNDEPKKFKQYQPYWWVKQDLKYGLVLSAIVLVLYFIYSGVKYLIS